METTKERLREQCFRLQLRLKGLEESLQRIRDFAALGITCIRCGGLGEEPTGKDGHLCEDCNGLGYDVELATESDARAYIEGLPE